MIAGEGPGIIEMNKLLAVLPRCQVARGCLSLLAAALVMIALPQPVLGKPVMTPAESLGLKGSLKVTKVVTGSLSTQPNTPFSINVVCGSQSYNPQLANGASVTYPGIAAGTTCVIKELTLPADFVANGQLCSWYRVSPPTQTVTINLQGGLVQNLTVVVANSYQCQSQPASLNVWKDVMGPISPPPIAQFTLRAVCGGQTHDRSVTPLTGASITGLTAGTTCIVTEPWLPGPFQYNGQTCTWVQMPPLSQSVQINVPWSNAHVYNTYTCAKK